MTAAEERIAQLESQLLDVTARLDQIDNRRLGFYQIPALSNDPTIPLAAEVSVLSETQSAKRTDLVIGWSNPRPDLIDHFELWAQNVTGQSKEPYLVASVKDSPAAFAIHADQDTGVAIQIRTFTKDGLSSGSESPSIGTSIVQQPLGAADIADGSIGDAKLDRTTDPIIVDTADIANAAIGTAQIQNAAITTALIANLAVGNAQINDLAASKITAGSLAADVAVLGTVLAGQIQAGTMSAVNVSAGTYSLTGTGLGSFTIDGTNGLRNISTFNDFVVFTSGTFIQGNTANNHRMFVGRQAATLEARDISGGINKVLITGHIADLGNADSGYIAVNDSAGNVGVELGVDGSNNGVIHVNGTQVLGPQGATISDPSGGGTQDAEARTAINTIIDRLQAHGIIA